MSRSQENALLGHLQTHGGSIKANKRRDLRHIIAGITKCKPDDVIHVVEKLAKDGKVNVVKNDGHLTEIKLSPSPKHPMRYSAKRHKAPGRAPLGKAEKLLADTNALLAILRNEARQNNGEARITKDVLARSANVTKTSANHALALLRRHSLYTASLGPNPIYVPDMGTSVPSLEQAVQYLDEMKEGKRSAIAERRKAVKKPQTEMPSLATPRSKAELEDALIKLGVRHIKLKQELEAMEKLKQELEGQVSQLKDELKQARTAPHSQAVDLIIQHLGSNE